MTTNAKKGIKPVQPKTKPKKDAQAAAKAKSEVENAVEGARHSVPEAQQPHDPTAAGKARRKASGGRLPPAGTVLKKMDRDGKVRCECTVNKDGVTYKGKQYTSLSGAAVAAAEDLGLNSRSHNGFIFWGLSKPPRAQKDPVDRLQGIYERYAEATKAGLALATGDEGKRKQVRIAVERHAELLGKLIA